MTVRPSGVKRSCLQSIAESFERRRAAANPKSRITRSRGGAKTLILRQGAHGIPDDLEGGGLCLDDRGAVGAGDALQHATDLRGFGVEVDALGLVGGRDRHQSHPEGCQLHGAGPVGEEQAHRRFGRGEDLELSISAPGGEIRLGGRIGPAGVLVGGGVCVGGGLLGQCTELDRDFGCGEGAGSCISRVR